MKRAGRWLAGGVAILALGAGALWVLWERCGFEGCPDVEVLSGYVPDEASVVVDREGGEVGRLFRVNRVYVPLDSLPPHVPAAFVATEDRRFWEHHGVDWRRAAGAAWTNVRAHGVVEGFSTITMQLARNIFPDRLPYTRRTIGRKLAEMRIALEIEERYDKRQILELYLNQIYFGHGAWGIEAAAQEYFGKAASRLTLAEGALLAGVVRSPQRLNPRDNPRGSVGRRGVVLGLMVEQGVVTAEEARSARAEPLRLGRGTIAPAVARAPYFLEEVRQELEEELGARIYTGGYVIRTSLDPGVQQAAEGELAAQLAAIERGAYGRYRHPVYHPGEGGSGAGGTPYLQGAVVVLDASTGDVLALVGGRDFRDSKFDRAVQAHRQPGSAFKPFVYGAALAAGYPPTYVLDDSPVQLVLPGGEVWSPRNFEGRYGGEVTLRDALVDSRNAATVRLAERVGVGQVAAFARSLGISDSLPAVPSLAIGAAEVTLLEMTAAYAALATLGRLPEPRLVSEVADRSGRVVWSRSPRARAALDPAVAFLLTDMLRDVVDRGTGSAVRGVGFHGAAAGKTGTTNDATDVWFLGFTPRRVAGVWIGFDQPRSIVAGATGGRLAAPVWGRIMRRSVPGGGGAGWAPGGGGGGGGFAARGGPGGGGGGGGRRRRGWRRAGWTPRGESWPRAVRCTAWRGPSTSWRGPRRPGGAVAVALPSSGARSPSPVNPTSTCRTARREWTRSPGGSAGSAPPSPRRRTRPRRAPWCRAAAARPRSRGIPPRPATAGPSPRPTPDCFACRRPRSRVHRGVAPTPSCPPSPSPGARPHPRVRSDPPHLSLPIPERAARAVDRPPPLAPLW
jgi:penicillin-binding protein 1A